MIETEKIITTNPNDQVLRTEIIPFITIPARTPDNQTTAPNTFKNATKDEIEAFVQNQKSLDEKGRAQLSDRLLKIQQRLKEQQSSQSDRGI